MNLQYLFVLNDNSTLTTVILVIESLNFLHKYSVDKQLS